MHPEGGTADVGGQEACKRQRSKFTFHFHTFGSTSFSGTFGNNVKDYLVQFAHNHSVLLSMHVWRTLLFHLPTNRILPLYTIENDSVASCCEHCKISGWGKHLVTKKDYHVIIPAYMEWKKPLNEDALDDETHILHGLIHSDGFGHLICINGKENGSSILCGREIMELWDRICSSLRVRKITVKDESKKRGMDIRLLHGIAYGHSWFWRWGYRFHHGRFGVTESDCDNAVQVLSSIELDKTIKDFSECQKIKQVISYYKDLSEGELLTIRDLIRFMLILRAAIPHVNQSLSTYSGQSANTNPTGASRFSALAERRPAGRLADTSKVVVDALQQMTDGVYSDVNILYQNVILSEAFKLAAKVVLNSNIFVKEWPVKEHDDHRFICQVMSCEGDCEGSEVVVVIPPFSTIGHLKQATQMAIRDTYYCLEKFVVTEIGGMEMEDNEEIISGAAESLVVKGNEADWETGLTYHRGPEKWTVKCKCGAVDDDGELMVECEKCKVWQHKYCHRINSTENYLCDECNLSPLHPGMDSRIVNCKCGAVVDDGSEMRRCDFCTVYVHARCVEDDDDPDHERFVACEGCRNTWLQPNIDVDDVELDHFVSNNVPSPQNPGLDDM